MTYSIRYSPEVRDHLQTLTARQRAAVFEGVRKSLTEHAEVPARNRKLLRPNSLATWELRLGNLRVFYDVSTSDEVVIVLAIGIKDRNEIRFGKEVWHL